MPIDWLSIQRNEAAKGYSYPEYPEGDLYSDLALMYIADYYRGKPPWEIAKDGLRSVNTKRTDPLPFTDTAVALYLQDRLDVPIPVDPNAGHDDMESSLFLDYGSDEMAVGAPPPLVPVRASAR